MTEFTSAVGGVYFFIGESFAYISLSQRSWKRWSWSGLPILPAKTREVQSMT
jgi:hypothetical protein